MAYFNQSLFFPTIHTTLNYKLNQGVATPGLTHLTYRWREEASGKGNETQAKQIVYAHVCMYSSVLQKREVGV